MSGPEDKDIPSQQEQDLPDRKDRVRIDWGDEPDDPGSGLVQRQAKHVSEEGTGLDGRQQISFVAKATGFQEAGELSRSLSMEVALQAETPDETIQTLEEAGEDPTDEDLADPEREVVVEVSLEDTNTARKERNLFIDPYCNTDTRFRFTAMNGSVNTVYVRCTGGSIAIRCGAGPLRVIRAGTGRVRLPNCPGDLYVRCREGATNFYLNLIWIRV
jgi:hypothetical protein